MNKVKRRLLVLTAHKIKKSLTPPKISGGDNSNHTLRFYTIDLIIERKISNDRNKRTN